MAKENQGLQIALIIFVILTIALGVTTFMFFKKAEDAELRAQAATESEKKQKDVAAKLTEEGNRLREVLGFAATDSLETINAAFKKDMDEFASSFEAPNRVYRQLVPKLSEELKKKIAALADAQVTITKLEKANEERERVKQAQIDQSLAAAAKAGEDLAARTKQFDDDRGKLTQEKDELAKKLQASQKQAETAMSQLQAKLDEAMAVAGRLKNIVKDRTEQLETVKRTTFEEPDGKIRWVNQRNGTVWINLGQADYLGRQTSFSVYPQDTNDVSRATKKADIEVTQILGEHLAEARIVSDSPANPIMPGDVIFTPIWRPGEQQHLALAGLIDVDNDGKSDLAAVLNLISMNGAVVDLYMDDNGKKVGKLSTNTRYLVLGKAPEVKPGDKPDKAEDAVYATYSAIMKEADQLGIKTIPLHELLNRMGFRRETHVVRFGPGANPDDFRAQPPEGVPKVSTGTVSPLFQPRQPPRGSAGSAY